MNYLTRKFRAEYRQSLSSAWQNCNRCGWVETSVVDGTGRLRCEGCGHEWGGE